MLDASRGVLASAATRHRHLAEERREDLLIRAFLESDLASMEATRGRIGEAERAGLGALETNEAREAQSEAIRDELFLAWVELLLRGDRERAVRRIDVALARQPLDALDPLDRPYAELASFRARAGDPARARTLLGEFARAVPPEIRGSGEIDRLRAEGEIALAEGRYDEAVARFRASDRGDCTICALPGLAAAYDSSGATDSAIAVYDRFVDTPWIDRFWGDKFPLAFVAGPTLERLARLQEETGDFDGAAVSWARLVELWKEADPELQPRVEAARKRLEAILAERG